ncbi:hypothetical protein ACOME3_005884 [Neoechinorhynchus agilis]
MPSNQNVFLFVPNLIGYLRVLLLLVFLLLSRHNCPVALVAYVFSVALDGIDGIVARRLDQCSDFGIMVDMVIDRCTSGCLCGIIGTLFPNYGIGFILWTSLDFASHWFHLHSCTVTGLGSHKDSISFSNDILKTYYSEKKIMMPLAIGTEVFLLSVYILAFTEGALYHAIMVIGTMTLPLFVAKTVVNIIQLMQASIRLVRSQYRSSSTSLLLSEKEN